MSFRFYFTSYGCHRSGNGQGKKRFFKVREKSGNLTFHYRAGQFFQYCQCSYSLISEKGEMLGKPMARFLKKEANTKKFGNDVVSIDRSATVS